MFIVNLYISEPECKDPKVAVLYLTDVFGIQLTENKLLVPSSPIVRLKHTYPSSQTAKQLTSSITLQSS